jgi:hypothetical protein
VIRAETRELELLAGDLDRSAEEITDRVRKVTSKTLLEIKREAQQRVAGHRSLPRLGYSFSYDIATTGDVVTGEVGADISKGQGALDHLIENGSPTSDPIPHWAPAADRQVPLWHQFLDEAAAEGLE